MILVKLFLLLIPMAISNATANQDFNALIQKINKKNAVATLSIQKLKKDYAKYQILDARELNEYKVSHLQGSIHVGYKNFDLQNIATKITKNKPIVIYCSLGVRSGKIAKKLIKKGYKVYNLSGGIFAWYNNGFEVFDSKKVKTNSVHGYNKKWSKWVLKGESVY